MFEIFESTISVIVMQTYLSDEDEDLYLSPVMRKKAVKVKHVKRREKKFDKKVRTASLFIIVIGENVVWLLSWFFNYTEGVASAQTETEAQRENQVRRERRPERYCRASSVFGARLCGSFQAKLQILLRGMWHEISC